MEQAPVAVVAAAGKSAFGANPTARQRQRNGLWSRAQSEQHAS